MNRTAYALITAAILLAGPAFSFAAEKINIIVSVPPQGTFVQRVGGEHVSVTVLVKPGESPHSYEPTAKQMVSLADASVYFHTGLELETALVPRLKRMYRKLEFVDLREGIDMRVMRATCNHHHEQGEKCDHVDSLDTKARRDPHTWLSPRNAKIQARTICDTLCRLDPKHADDYRRGLAEFHQELSRVHAEVAGVLRPYKHGKVFVFHPAFGYFLDEFGLEQVAVEIEGKQPTAAQLVKLIDHAKREKARVVFVQPQFSKRSAKVVADAIGGAVVPIDPLASDYVGNLHDMAERIEAGLKRN